MKLTRQSVLAASSLIIGGIIGASALVALADSTWVSAPSAGPMNNNTSAPINVGSVTQTKASGLTIQGLLSTGNLQFQPGGATVAVGSTLVATDTAGTVAWGAPSAAAAINSTGYVGWSETVSGSGAAVACTSGVHFGDGNCTSSLVNYNGNWVNQVNISCAHGSITATVVGITSSFGGGAANVTTKYLGYCVKIN